jgi:hypothetical protein
VDLAALQREVDEVRGACTALGSPLVFSHNDLLSGNILVLQPKGSTSASDDGPLQLIDFEYGACCRRCSRPPAAPGRRRPPRGAPPVLHCTRQAAEGRLRRRRRGVLVPRLRPGQPLQ